MDVGKRFGWRAKPGASLGLILRALGVLDVPLMACVGECG
jgi:hypothetical protein